ncbi:hypothetical protein [Longimicrobium sp.]|uniref:hypothetical protein n=1 Tax=Longimicrobium sp. TaxID=2029185 RepID=UPI002C2C3C16|nr:hypothetical protein [Longimicrobium sp.]HSU16937.1 hypothetical protein [Longimicrobium sp.]
MSDYERSTVLPTREIFAKASQIFTERAELQRTEETAHRVTYTGGEGTVTLEAHRHGPSTVVTVRTDRLRTSKVDGVVRYLLNQLPYQWGDPPRE